MVYISGKMTGVPNYREIFAKHEEALKTLGNEVFNPVYLSDYIIAKNHIDPNKAFDEKLRGIFLKEDIKALVNCDKIYMIPGWETSEGAQLERHVAEKCGIPVIEGMDI